MGRALTIEEFSNTAWRVICGASLDSNNGFKLDSESCPFNCSHYFKF